MTSSPPLSGFKVVDFTHVMAGPFCTHTLNLLGADVIKIERIGEGDVMRHYDTREEYKNIAPPFCAINAGKQSIALDLKSSEAIKITKKLIAQSDVVVENFRPGVLTRLGLGYEELKTNNPGLIYCSVTGFGQEGPLKNNPAYDHIVQAMSGVMSLTGEPGSKHTKVGFPVLDTFAGYTAAMAIMTALLQRERGGGGQAIDIAMLDASLNLMISMVAPYLIAGDVPKKVGNRGFNMSPTSDTFRAKDSEISIGANTQTQYIALCNVLQREDLMSDPRFSEREQRIANEQQLRIEIENTTTQQPAVEWEDALNRAGVPSAAIRSIPEIAQHPHLENRHLKIPMHFPTGERPNDDRPSGDSPRSDSTKFTLGPGFFMDSMDTSALPAPPQLGEHSELILSNLGYSKAQIEQLLESKVIQTSA